jgi:hypothetical protein
MIVNVFTHSINNPTISDCLASFERTFGKYEVKVWFDGRNTSGLADGYIKAIEQCEDDYIFMLEHDWDFVRKPEHSLQEICEMMAKDNIPHLRFNKRSNEPAMYDKWLIDKGWYCETPFVSNNPHIINRIEYLDRINWMKRVGRDKGVEERVSWYANGAIYGGMGYPQVIRHLRGR